MPMIEEGARPNHRPSSWPIGGGGMGARIRAHDWGSTPLGTSDAWQQSLKSSVDLLLSVGVPMMMMSGVDLIQIYNDAYAELIVGEGMDGLGISVRDRLPYFLETDASILDRVLEGESVSRGDPRHPGMRQGRGSDTWFNATFSPARDDAGEISGIVMIAFDVTSYMLAERRLAAELQHRVRNSLSVIRSIARRTAENSETLEEFADHLDGRLDAFARTQGAIVSYGTGGLDLHSLIIDEMAAAVTQEGDQFTLSGPDVNLQPRAAETLGLAFHELATNAIKFGALAVEAGSIAVSWSIEGGSDDGRLAIIWEERRPGPLLALPTHRGFGTDLLECTLEYQLEGETTLEYGSTGLRCTIVVPLAANIIAEHIIE